MSLRILVRIMPARTAVGGAPGRVPLLRFAYARHAMALSDHPGVQSGLCDSYEAAQAAIPTRKRAGRDTEAAAEIWVGQIDPVRPSSYPLFFWQHMLLREGTVVTDYGGSVGFTYYADRRFGDLPPRARWCVVELPSLAAQGRRIAAGCDAPRLEFATDIAAAPPNDILVAAGALQYMPRAVPGLLESLPGRPRHLLINKVALTPGEAFWTLQNFGPGAAPYRVWNEAGFLRYFEGAGYALRDRWAVAELSLDMPPHPSRSVPELTGMVFEDTSPR